MSRGFAHLTPEQRKAVSIKGGSAPHKSRGGFDVMPPEQRRAIARLGGFNAHRRHTFTPEQAAEAGRARWGK